MKKLFILIFLFATNAFCQKMELGKVTVEELSEKAHPLDSLASAAYIFKTGETTFYNNSDGNWLVTTEVKYKIKIYNKNSFEKANHEVAFYIGGSISEKVFFSDAITYNLVNGKIEKTKLKSEGEFTETVNEEWKIKKIVMPAVKEGSVIEFSYKLISPYISRINDWYFQYDIPMNYVSYTTYTPEYFQYRTIIKGFETINIESELSNSTYYNELKTVYSKKDIPAIKDEAYVNNIKNYTSILQYELASIRLKNGSVENLSLDWNGVTKQIYDNENFGRELKFASYFEEDLKPLLENVTLRDDKIKVVLKYVKDVMSWNEKHGIYCDKGVKKAYKERTGNVAEINLMLVAMLRYAGLDASPVLLSTKSNGISSFPNRTAFNYVIAAVEIKEDLILLDATNSNTFFNILPSKVLNWSGRLIRDTGSSTDIDLMPKTVSNDRITIMATINESGNVTGKFREQYFDYAAYFFRDNNDKINKEVYIEKLEKRYPGIEITEYSVSNIDNLENPVVENFSFEHSNLVETIGDKIYFSPLLFFEKKENPFKQEKRNFPIDFSVPFNDTFNIIINIPEGYEVESLPEKVNLVLEQNIGKYLFNISTSLNSIQITSTYNINESIVPSSQYEALKLFYKKMIEKQNEKIVLKKI